MKAADYNPDTISYIRTCANIRKQPDDVARKLGWDRPLLDSVCRTHQIVFPGVKTAPVLSERTNLWPAERAADRNR